MKVSLRHVIVNGKDRPSHLDQLTVRGVIPVGGDEEQAAIEVGDEVAGDLATVGDVVLVVNATRAVVDRLEPDGSFLVELYFLCGIDVGGEIFRWP